MDPKAINAPLFIEHGEPPNSHEFANKKAEGLDNRNTEIVWRA